jgi:PadR family transcriptional regulator PadR
MTPPSRRDELLPGTLDMLILKTLARRGDQHGFEIAEMIRLTSCDVLHVEEGSLYPALQRMMVKGWISGTWGRTPENRRARFYQLTAGGRRHLAAEVATYERVAGAIGLILRPA